MSKITTCTSHPQLPCTLSKHTNHVDMPCDVAVMPSHTCGFGGIFLLARMLWSSFSLHYLTAATTYIDDNARVEQRKAGQKQKCDGG
jgi:hypothetical protein